MENANNVYEISGNPLAMELYIKRYGLRTNVEQDKIQEIEQEIIREGLKLQRQRAENKLDMENVKKAIEELEALNEAMHKNQCYACSYEFIETSDKFGTAIIADAIDLLKTYLSGNNDNGPGIGQFQDCEYIEKTIKGLDCCLAVKYAGTQICSDCPYKEKDGRGMIPCEDYLMADALEFLKNYKKHTK